MFHPMNSVDGMMIHQFHLIAKNDMRAIYFDVDTMKTYETRNMSLNLQDMIGVPFLNGEAPNDFKDISSL